MLSFSVAFIMARLSRPVILMVMTFLSITRAAVFFTSPTMLQNVVLFNNEIYVGATNTLYRLDALLKQLASVDTGAGPENRALCTPGNSSQNVNKILTVYEKGPYLIGCGTLCQGYCSTYDLLTLKLKEEVSNRFVAAKYDWASTEALISKAPDGKGGHQDVLFVGATNYKILDFLRGKIAAVASLSLVEGALFRFIFVKGAELVFKIDAEEYVVDYVHAFINNNFSYLATVQPEAIGSSSYHSKLVRVCQSDVTYSSYTELPISCQDSAGKTTYRILVSATTVLVTGKAASILKVPDGDTVFVGLFGESVPNGKTLTGKYAVCAYSLKNVNRGFQQAIDRCLTSDPSIPRGLPWSTNGAGMCTKVQPDYCGKNHEYPIGGSTPLVVKTSLVYSKSRLSSVNVFVHPRGFAVFLGSESGSLLQFTANDDVGLSQYGEEVIEKGQSIRKIVFSKDGASIFVMGNFKLVKMTVANCEKRSTCEECLAGPGCGWCTLESKCSMKSECSGAEKALRFIETSDSLCPKITEVKPKALSALLTKQVTVVADHLPPLSSSENYICTFNGAKSVAQVTENNLVCNLPEDIPRVSPAQFTNEITISIQLSVTHLDLISQNTVLYNCSVHTTCLRCTQSKYNCDWCGNSLRCVDGNSAGCGSTGNIIPHTGSSVSAANTHCPRVMGVVEEFIPHDVKRELQVTGKHLPVPEGEFHYSCVVSLDGMNFTSEVVSHNVSALRCAGVQYTFKQNVESMQGDVHVLYGGRHLDSLEVLKITVYRCDFKGKECSICVTSPVPWGCGWCMAKGHCGVAELCDTKWVNSSCPAPRITEFFPKAGSIQGGTTIIIKGIDLGTTFSDISKVTVAGTDCELDKTLYLPSRQVACKTQDQSKEIKGKIVVFVQTMENHALQEGASSEDFAFKTPRVQDFSPSIGPCSGGTVLTTSGVNLDIGAQVSVSVSGKPCSVITRTAEKIKCKTSAQGNCLPNRKRRAPGANAVVVSFDGHDVPSTSNQSFVYTADPTISQYYTNKKAQSIRTYVSGGQVFTVEGERLDIIQRPEMIFHVFPSRQNATGVCQVQSSNVMRCAAPNVSALVLNQNGSIVGLGFVMDNVKALLHLTNITVVKDPVFLSFTGKDNTRVLKTSDLILEGTNLEVLHKADVRVTVGGLDCIVTSLDERLVCTVPDKEARDKVIAKDTNPAVIVYIGENGLQYHVGFIKFFKAEQNEVPLLLYIGPAAAGVFVLIIVIIVLVILYRRRNKKEKEYHKAYQKEMDNLESRYARECKEAFAELQTEITDLTSDLSLSVVPYLNFETYAMRILFPGIEIHPVMEKECNKSDAWKKGMVALCNLIKEKDFLLSFLRTLEQNSNFSMRDRCKVASLLMVSLQDDMAYCTSVLRDLLSDLIKKSVESGRTKLLLRRTESIAEKLLTNWLAYCLHGFVEDRVGETLFRLFAAINVLLDKEPVDAVTHEARNSLSEDKLLRQKVDFKTLNVKVEYDHEECIHVQLLNVDTISQAKQKALNVIYKNVPFSQRPNKDTLELGWILPTGGMKVMQDEDDSSIIDGEWKRVNTLEHYRVSDGALLRLSPCGTNYSIVPGSPVFHDATLPSLAFQPNNSSTPMLNHNASEHGSRLWHLVKASDYPVETRDDSRHSKMMAEVYLTRLLKTKGTLQNFVDDLFDAIFKVSAKNSSVPPAVKYLFDFLDKQATLMGMKDSEVIHTWKNNSLPLRFWINIIKNPNFIFDVFKSSTVDSCLSVVGQLFMDSCSPDEHRLGKDSPSNKLLYAKDIPKYKHKVARFYSDIRDMPPVNDNELSLTFMKISKKYGSTFNHLNAATDLLGYAVKYKVAVMEDLERADMQGYADRLQEIMETLPDD